MEVVSLPVHQPLIFKLHVLDRSKDIGEFLLVLLQRGVHYASEIFFETLDNIWYYLVKIIKDHTHPTIFHKIVEDMEFFDEFLKQMLEFGFFLG